MISQIIIERRDSQVREVGKTHVHDSAVDVAELLEAEEPRTVCGVIKGERLGERQPDTWQWILSNDSKLCEVEEKLEEQILTVVA
jgi:hypothetical protein